MMKMLKAAALASAALIATAAPLSSATAQTRLGVGLADLEGAMVQSTTYQNAMNSIKTTYGSQFQQYEARAKSAQAELKPLEDAYRAAAASGNQANIQSTGQALQAKQRQLEAQLAPLQRPLAMAQNYVRQQLGQKIGQAAQNVVKAKRIDLLLSPEAALWSEAYVDVTKDIAAELSKLMPTVSVTPPATPAAAAPAAAPAKPPKGR